MKVGYRRVSTSEQNLDRQDMSGVERVFEDKASGKNTERVALQEMIDFVRPGAIQENIAAIQNTKTKTRNMDYGIYIFRTGDVITLPEELIKDLNNAITLLNDDLDE